MQLVSEWPSDLHPIPQTQQVRLRATAVLTLCTGLPASASASRRRWSLVVRVLALKRLKRASEML